jgi:hypothetical protein
MEEKKQQSVVRVLFKKLPINPLTSAINSNFSHHLKESLRALPEVYFTLFIRYSFILAL